MQRPADSTAVLTTRTFIETPENVRLGFRLAGPGARVGAYALDLIARLMLFVGASMLLGLTTPAFGSGVSTGVMLVVAFLLEWGYGAFFETWWSGQTPGKRAFGLRVVKVEGYAIGFQDAMLRNILRAADFAPFFYAAGFISMSLTSRMQRIGDIAAGTMVIRERRPALSGDLTSLEDLEPFPLAEFEHRYRPTEKTLETIEALFRRKDELSRARVDEIALILAQPLSERLRTPESQRYALESPAEFVFRVLCARREGARSRAA